jgi:hypothetical protein
VSGKRKGGAKPQKGEREIRAEVEREFAAREQILRETMQAQQEEVEQMRGAIAELTAAKPGRAFRKRSIILGPLDITIKGSDVTESEVVIEQYGGFLGVRVGDAIGFPMAAGPQREVYRYDAPSGTAGDPNALMPTTTTRQQYDLQDAVLASIGVGSQTNFDAHGLAGNDPTVINAALAPQADPRRPSAFQHEADPTIVGQYGWTGRGQRPPGWKDPDLVPPERSN